MKYLTNLIAIGMVALLVFGAIKFKDSNAYNTLRWHIGGFVQKGKNFVEVRKRNIREELKPSRNRPITLIQAQGELENWLPEVFLEEFSDQDWAQMWDLIYTPEKVKEGGHTVYRYKTREEVQGILRYEHLGLSYLKDNDWWELWGIAKISWEDD